MSASRGMPHTMTSGRVTGAYGCMNVHACPIPAMPAHAAEGASSHTRLLNDVELDPVEQCVVLDWTGVSGPAA
jgi:hypothetical protein